MRHNLVVTTVVASLQLSYRKVVAMKSLSIPGSNPEPNPTSKVDALIRLLAGSYLVTSVVYYMFSKDATLLNHLSEVLPLAIGYEVQRLLQKRG
jgi:hypothetical protein